jgi:hypothetical protein
MEKAVVERQRVHLLRHGLRDAGAPVPGVHAPQARHGVEDLLVFGIPDIDAVAPHDDAGALVQQAGVVGERMQKMRGVELLQGRGVEAGVHASRCRCKLDRCSQRCTGRRRCHD